MDQLLELITGDSLLAAFLGLALVFLSTAIAGMYIAAFIQGRSVSFWPPKIGERPIHPTSDPPTTVKSPAAATASAGPSDLGGGPVIGRGTTLEAASGMTYTVESDFYGGANATLYKARDSSENVVIAKVFWRGLMPNSPAWTLFNQEQRTAEILNHRNVVRTLDRGLRGGYPFTIMEYFGGGTLRDWLRTHDRLPGPEILSVASQIAAAVDYAHARGVLHRDIKPGNILFESGPNARIALGDFGIARIFGAVERDITAVGGEFVGSPGYLAPEIIDGNPPTRASDIYGFGVVLYEMICKTVPFDEIQDVHALLRAKAGEDPQDIRMFRDDVPAQVADRLALTLCRDPSRRPSSTHAVISGIENEISHL